MSSGKRAFNWLKSKRWWKEVDDDSDVSLMALLHCNFDGFSWQTLDSSDLLVNSFCGWCWCCSSSVESVPEEQLPTPIGHECNVYVNWHIEGFPCSIEGWRNKTNQNTIVINQILLINPFQILINNCYFYSLFSKFPFSMFFFVELN